MIDFDVDIRGFQTFTEESIKHLDAKTQLTILRALALTFIGKVVPRTPVDTGQSRAGWTAAAGRIGGVKGVSTEIELNAGPGGDHAMQELGRKQSSYKESTAGGQAGLQIFNGVPHIVYLELGSSQQAPSGFVRQTIRELSPDFKIGMEREVEKQLRLANIKARRESGLRQGIGRRPRSGRLNLARR